MIKLKHFNDQDIEYANHIAKLKLYKDDEEKRETTHNSPSDTQQWETIHNSSSNTQECRDAQCTNKENNDEQPVNVPKSSMKIAEDVNVSPVTLTPKNKMFKEGKMRVKQATKTACEILEVVWNLEQMSRKESSLNFVAPLELEKKNKHWEDFTRLAKRSLYTLKREVNMLSLKISAPLLKLPDSVLRILASSSRSCLHLLKGLENFADEIKVGRKGHFILREALIVAQQIILIMAMGGTSLTSRNNINVKHDASHLRSLEQSFTESYEILTSELDSTALTLLQPKSVRKKLSHLAHNYATLKKDKKQRKYKFIAPLMDAELAQSENDNFNSSETSLKSRVYHEPWTENLEDGRIIQFIHDSLSPKLKRKMERRKCALEPTKAGGRPSSSMFESEKSGVPERQLDETYGISEKMADAVFDGILPYFENNLKNVDDEREPGMEVADRNLVMEARKKIENLQERVIKLEAVSQKHQRLHSTLLHRLRKDPNSMDLGSVIQSAQISLKKCAESDYPFPYSVYSVDRAIENLQRGTTMDVNPSGTRSQDRREESQQPIIHFPSLHSELKAEKIDFWRVLVDNDFISKPRSEHLDIGHQPPDLDASKDEPNRFSHNPERPLDKEIQVSLTSLYESTFEKTSNDSQSPEEDSGSGTQNQDRENSALDSRQVDSQIAEGSQQDRENSEDPEQVDTEISGDSEQVYSEISIVSDQCDDKQQSRSTASHTRESVGI